MPRSPISWDPFWSACADERTIVCLHFGSGRGMVCPTLDAPMDAVITLMPIAMVDCAADLLWSPVLRKFPTLKFAFFRYDPFRHVPKAQATVAALRAQAKDVDLSLRSHGGLRPSEGDEIVTAGQVAKQLAGLMGAPR